MSPLAVPNLRCFLVSSIEMSLAIGFFTLGDDDFAVTVRLFDQFGKTFFGLIYIDTQHPSYSPCFPFNSLSSNPHSVSFLLSKTYSIN
jgi:hypothetical protein